MREENKERERKVEEESDSRVLPVPPAMDAGFELVRCVYCILFSARKKVEMDKSKRVTKEEEGIHWTFPFSSENEPVGRGVWTAGIGYFILSESYIFILKFLTVEQFNMIFI